MYTGMQKQPARLGQFEGIRPGFGNFENFGDFGQGDTASGIITAIGNAVNGIVSAITTSEVLKVQSKEAGRTAREIAAENTKKLEISSRAQVEIAKVEVKNVETTYSGLTKIIGVSGVVMSGLLLAGAFAYSTASAARGEYEVEYKPVFSR